MNQLGAKNLSPPRGPVCCSSVKKAIPWNMNVHAPARLWIMSMGDDRGLTLVPEAACSAGMAGAGSPMFMPGMC